MCIQVEQLINDKITITDMQELTIVADSIVQLFSSYINSECADL